MTRRSSRDLLITVRTEGAILPPDLLQRVLDLDRTLPGLTPEAYHLASGESFGEATSRAWQRLQAPWAIFKAVREKLPETDTGTTVTRQRWLLPLFQELGYGRLTQTAAVKADGMDFSVFSNWGGRVPIHLVGCSVDLDSRTAGIRGAAKVSPHGLVQDLLNRSDSHLWGFVSNGLLLRVQRDNLSLTRQSFVQFDLEAMFEGGAYSDFALLWMVCHQSRVEAEKPEQCLLEQWSKLAQEEGARALENLRQGVEASIVALGQGFLAHEGNRDLRERLRTGTLSTQDFYRQLLRLVYRLIFLFVAEDREVLQSNEAAPEARDLYQRYYSTKRLRSLASRRRGTRHGDLFVALRLVMDGLGGEKDCLPLALPALGSYLWSRQALPDLHEASLSNEHLLNAVRALALSSEEGALRPVDYKNLGAEELGSVYESLLELHPQLHLEAAEFLLDTAAGNERKTTGSYYTPDSLIQCLLDSALNPVLEEAAKKPKPEQAILDLKVCDPACGSGHFLIGAAHRIAKRLASVRTGDDEPSPEAVRTALRDVIGRCLYGVDLNPMAVELCKVSLWMEALEPGKPLSFLDHHIRCGNSLLGTTPALMAKGIPDEAFTPIEGDDKEACRQLKKRNKAEREAFIKPDLWASEAAATYEAIETQARTLSTLPDESLHAVKEKEMRFGQLEDSTAYRRARIAADAWCAAFVWNKAIGPEGRVADPKPITHDVLISLQEDLDKVPIDTIQEVERLADRYHFFHWHLAFPEVFAGGGFDVVLGNPPWDKVELLEREWFAERRPDIANAQTAAKRKSRIEALRSEDKALYALYRDAVRTIDAQRHFMRDSGRYPLCSTGRTNLYSIFAEAGRNSVTQGARVGFILPSGIGTDDSTKTFFRDLLVKQQLVSFYDFENGRGIFPAVQGNVKFCLFTLASGGIPYFEIAAQLDDVGQLKDPSVKYWLSLKEVELINPNTCNAPTFTSARDALINTSIYTLFRVLVSEGPPEQNPWGVSLRQGHFNMTSDSGHFKTSNELEALGCSLVGNHFIKERLSFVPLCEAKLVFQYDHRAATFSGTSELDRYRTHAGTREITAIQHQDAGSVVSPRYWVSKELFEKEARGARWFLVFRDIISAVADARSLVATIVPNWGMGNTLPIVNIGVGARNSANLLAHLNSFVADYLMRQKACGSHLNFYIFKQLPVPPPSLFSEPCFWSAGDETLGEWILPRVLELTFTAWDLEPFAHDCDYVGPPFRWDEERRFLLRCELDAAFFHLYLPMTATGEWRMARKASGDVRDETPEELAELNKHFPTPRHAVDYIMETFPIVKRRDQEKHGEYRTKRVILEIYDAMAAAISTGIPYQTRLDPPPADPRCAHDPSTRPAWVDFLFHSNPTERGVQEAPGQCGAKKPAGADGAGRPFSAAGEVNTEPPSLFSQDSRTPPRPPVGSLFNAQPSDPYAQIKALLQERLTITSTDAQLATGLNAAGVRFHLQRLIQDGLAVMEGQRRGARYVLREPE